MATKFKIGPWLDTKNKDAAYWDALHLMDKYEPSRTLKNEPYTKEELLYLLTKDNNHSLFPHLYALQKSISPNDYKVYEAQIEAQAMQRLKIEGDLFKSLAEQSYQVKTQVNALELDLLRIYSLRSEERKNLDKILNKNNKQEELQSLINIAQLREKEETLERAKTEAQLKLVECNNKFKSQAQSLLQSPSTKIIEIFVSPGVAEYINQEISALGNISVIVEEDMECVQ